MPVDIYNSTKREHPRRHSRKPECAYKFLETLFPAINGKMKYKEENKNE